jgi:hypothetical protein
VVHSKPQPLYRREILHENGWTSGLIWAGVDNGLFRPGGFGAQPCEPVRIRNTDNVIPAPGFSHLPLQINSLYSAVIEKYTV